jgi:hypothetical protein
MLVVLYLEGLLLGLLTLGYLLLTTILVSAGSPQVSYAITFVFGGTYGLGSLWWMLLMSIEQLQKGRRYAIPLLVKVGIATGFLFAIFLILYSWLFQNGSYVASPFPLGFLVLVSIPCGIALHAICLLQENLNEFSGERLLPPDLT